MMQFLKGLLKRENFSSGGPWEPIAGYSRSVKVGPFVYVAGTTATDSSGKVIGNDAREQTLETLRNIEKALKMAGATLEHVVRTRIYITSAEDGELVCRTHGEFFQNILPASTLLVVKQLILPELLVEIDADAIIL